MDSEKLLQHRPFRTAHVFRRCLGGRVLLFRTLFRLKGCVRYSGMCVLKACASIRGGGGFTSYFFFGYRCGAGASEAMFSIAVFVRANIEAPETPNALRWLWGRPEATIACVSHGGILGMTLAQRLRPSRTEGCTGHNPRWNLFRGRRPTFVNGDSPNQTQLSCKPVASFESDLPIRLTAFSMWPCDEFGFGVIGNLEWGSIGRKWPPPLQRIGRRIFIMERIESDKVFI